MMKNININNMSATRIVVAAFGIFAGITGIIAGIFEILQGNTATNGFVISTIDPDHPLSTDFTYFSVSIIPNYLLTGIAALIMSTLFMIWSIGFVHRKHGVKILFILAILQMLVGGGWVIDLASLTCLLATQIGHPLNLWRTKMPVSIRDWSVKLLPFSMIIYVIVALSMNALSILALNDASYLEIITVLAALMFLPMILLPLGAISHDIQRDIGIENT